jgi:hypothetical protein
VLFVTCVRFAARYEVAAVCWEVFYSLSIVRSM